MADRIAVRCESRECDPSALRLSITDTVWYLLDVTADGVYPHQPSPADPIMQLVCLDCGRTRSVAAALRARLRFE